MHTIELIIEQNEFKIFQHNELPGQHNETIQTLSSCRTQSTTIRCPSQKSNLGEPEPAYHKLLYNKKLHRLASHSSYTINYSLR